MDLLAAALARPRVRVNQVGYRVDGPKAATVVTDAAGPLAVTVSGDRTVWRGESVPAGTDSGMGVHTVDFSGLRAAGTFRMAAGGLVSHPFRVGPDPYAGLVGDALRFLYGQRSGMALADAVLPGYARPAGHVGVPPNQGDTAVGGSVGYPGWRFDGPVDVSGGWYDAGDHGKYVAGGGFAAALVLAAAERYPGVPLPAGPSLLDEALWQVDWMVRMQVPAGAQHAGLAFHRVHDDAWTPLPLLPHRDPAPRLLHRPSTAAALNLAAVAAQAARLTRPGSPVPGAGPNPSGPAGPDEGGPVAGRSERLLAVARRAYAAALAEPDLYAPDDRGAHGGGPYDDADVTDDFYWAAAELWLTTGEPAYLAALRDSPCHHRAATALEWNDLTLWARIQLADRLPEARAGVLAAADALLAVARAQPWGQPYAPDDGWDWGSSGAILNRLAVLAAAHRLTGDPAYRDGVLGGLDYLFGRNPVGLSYVTGWGTDTAHRQRVRHFGHALDPAYPPPPRGSVAGGPASKDFPGWPADPRFAGLPDQLHHVDDPTSETTNDVCIRWNAALVLVATTLA